MSCTVGVTGFIGTWTTRAFLERGYNVLGTARSKDKGEWLSSQDWVKAGPGNFEHVIVEDVAWQPGAFDEAVKDVDVIVHTASPVSLRPGPDPSKIIDPAVNGTLGILRSTLKNGSIVKRVVITPSVAAILEPTEIRRVLTKNDWNGYSVGDVETKGAASEHLYRASKTLTERAVWAFVEGNKENLNVDVTTILPAMAYGPIIHHAPSLSKLNGSLKLFYDNVHKEAPLDSLAGNGNFVDVPDVASMHVDVVESDKAAGQGFIASSGFHTWQDVYDSLNAHSNPIGGVPVGTPGAGKNVFGPIYHDNEKSKTLLGYYRTLEDMSYETLLSMKEHGFW